jgi:5'-methylthioadenosine phosphorylase
METPAEVGKYRQYGGQLIGMTLCPEAFLARELEMCYAACCFVTNFAEGMSDTPDAPEEVFGGLATAAERDAANATASRFPEIVAALLNALPGTERTCTCNRAMERFRRRGLIGTDWHEWVRA